MYRPGETPSGDNQPPQTKSKKKKKKKKIESTYTLSTPPPFQLLIRGYFEKFLDSPGSTGVTPTLAHFQHDPAEFLGSFVTTM